MFCIFTGYAQTATEWFEKGTTTQNKQKAIEYFTKAIANKYFPLENAYYKRGFAKEMLKKYQEAIADYDTVICLLSSSYLAYSSRGICKNELENYESAMIDFQQAIFHAVVFVYFVQQKFATRCTTQTNLEIICYYQNLQQELSP